MSLAYTIQAAQDRHRMRPAPVDPGTVRRPRRTKAADIEPPKLRLVHDAEKLVAEGASQPNPKKHHFSQPMHRVLQALNEMFSFCLVVVVVSSVGVGGYVAGWNDRIMQDARAAVAEIMASDALPSPLPQIGEFDREKGMAK